MKRKFLKPGVQPGVSAESPPLRINGNIPVELRPMKTGWSPIKDLAAAVPLDALTKICEPCDNSHRQRAVSEDLEWMFSDETDQRFSFVRLVGYWRLNQASLENLFCCVSTNLQ